MQISFKTKALYWFARFIQVQLLLSLISLPILISWGLPISILAPIGNLIFSPFLSAFLCLSCFIFFFELAHIPNTWLISVLESLTDAWLWLINMPSKKWLMGFPAPAWFILTAIPVTAFVLLQWRKTNTPARSITCLALLLFTACIGIKIGCTPQKTIELIPCNKGHVVLIKDKDKITLVDPGFIGQRLSMPSWIEYTLRPHLIKKIGTTKIDYLIILQPSKLTFEAVELLSSKLTINTVYLVLWQGLLPHKEWRSFATMKKTLAEKSIKLKRIPGFYETSVPFDDTHDLVITPLKKDIQHAQVTYPALSVTCCVDKQKVTIYSAKHKKHLNREEKNALR